MECFLTMMNATPFDIRVNIQANHEQIQYGISSGGQVMHPFTASEDAPYHFKTMAQQINGPIHSREEEHTTTIDMTIRVLPDNDGQHLVFSFEKGEIDF